MQNCKNCIICKVSGLLVLAGAINWGLVGVLQMDLVSRILGPMTMASRVVYTLVGVAGVLKLLSCFKGCPACKKE